jgi:GNAT superfamily N-acetyltransferase
MPGGLIIRTEVRPGDIGSMVLIHANYYSKVHRWNEEFEAYVAIPLAELVLRKRPDERLWIVESDGDVKGCIALARSDEGTAQLRWFYLDPSLRGKGLGTRLVMDLLAFAREKRYRRVILWTVDSLWDAIRVYERCGFRAVERKAHKVWGLDLVEVMYELEL